MTTSKRLLWVDTALADITKFPAPVRREAGFQLAKVEGGESPDDWKALSAIGTGIIEIRLRGTEGIFRVVFVANFSEAIYVLHCFQKKTQALSKHDVQIISRRYRAVSSMSRG
jgi:phage-related protein